METYEQILERMQAEYAAKTGSSPDQAADIGIRLQVLAGELYRMQAGVEWIRRQATPQTAQGEWLDMHGAQRGVERKPAQKAQGVLYFCRYLPLSFDLVIPKGTVCASYGGEAMEYETIEEISLPAGDLAIGVPAQAVESGSRGNAAVNYINTLVTPVNGIQYVLNHEPFTGGTDPEEDESYRQRVLGAFSQPVVLGNAAYYEEAVRSVEGVGLVQAVQEDDAVTLYIWGQGKAPEQDVLAAVTAKVEAIRPAGATVTVKSATTKKCNLMGNVKMRAGLDFTTAKERAKTALTDWFTGLNIGDSVYVGDLCRVVLTDPAIGKLSVGSNVNDHIGTAGVLPIFGVLSLTEIT